MPAFQHTVEIAAPVAAVFAWFRVPANLVRVTPPELHLEIVAAPPLVEQGSRLELRSRRWGMSLQSVVEITHLAIDHLMVEEQRTGPFRQWKHVHRFAAIDDAHTRLTDEIAFEPPGGLLGFIVTAASVQRELTAFFHYRDQRLREWSAEYGHR